MPAPFNRNPTAGVDRCRTSQGLEAIFRLRVSSGLKVASYDGAFFRRIPTDVDLPQIDADKTITATVAHDATPLHGRPECYFQAALLYTTPSGERRVCPGRCIASAWHGCEPLSGPTRRVMPGPCPDLGPQRCPVRPRSADAFASTTWRAR